MYKTPEQLLEEMLEVRKQRTKQYKNSRVSAHKMIAEVTQSMIEQNCSIKLPHDLDPRMGALFMVALKLQRCSLEGEPREDDYLDMINYALIAYECAITEKGTEHLPVVEDAISYQTKGLSVPIVGYRYRFRKTDGTGGLYKCFAVTDTDVRAFNLTNDNICEIPIELFQLEYDLDTDPLLNEWFFNNLKIGFELKHTATQEKYLIKQKHNFNRTLGITSISGRGHGNLKDKDCFLISEDELNEEYVLC